MASESRRSLAAVWFADVAGYTALSGTDEDGALSVVAALKRHAQDAVQAGEGRIVKFLGDGVLAVFDSADGAVRSALLLLDSFAGSPAAREHGCGLRIGAHVGEVVHDAEQDVFGDGVNLASRIEGIAEPGQLVVSAALARLIRQRRDFEVRELGARRLKGVADPVELFHATWSERAVRKSGGRPTGPASPSWFSGTTGRMAGVLATALLVAGLGWALVFGAPGTGPDPARAGIGSVAVLPLDNFTGDPGQAHVVAALHEALISELTKVGGLTVKSRTTVQRFASSDLSLPAIAAELGGVDAVVEGSVFRAGDSVRVTIQLIDAATDDHLLANDYWGTLSGVLELQTRVARAIAREVKGELSPEETHRLTADRVLDPEAVDLYMRGRAAFFTVGAAGPEALQEAIAFFRRALEIEPGYALAWAGLADAFLVYAHTGMAAHEAFPRAEDAALKAIEIDPGLADGHAALGDVRFHYDWDWAAAEEEFQRALELNPGYVVAHWWYSGLLAAVGRTDEAVDEIQRGLELDPLTPGTHGFAVRILFYARRFEEAVATVGRMDQLGIPTYFGAPWGALALLRLGQPDEALTVVRTSYDQRPTPYDRMALACVLHRLERPDEALRFVEALETAYEAGEMPNATAPGIARICIGDVEGGMDWLETAERDRDGVLPWIAVNPALDPVREEPRFRALVRRVGLQAVGRSPTSGDPSGPGLDGESGGDA